MSTDDGNNDEGRIVNNEEASNDFQEDFGSDGVDYSDHFTTNRVFTSSKEGFNWAYQTALGLGFGIKRESNKRRGRNTELRVDYFVCRRGGRRPKNRDGDTLMRANTSFQWCDCKFKMKIVEVQADPPQWLLYMGRVGVHNHSLVQYCDGDRYYAKLDDAELAYIDAQVRAHVPPAMISAGLHQRNPEKSRPARRQIYNRGQKVRTDDREGRNPAQQMLALAVQHKYVYYWVSDESTRQLTHVFMAHPEAVKMFRSYYYVVIMDSTYKTNQYGLPLVEMVGVTPVGRTFVIAYAFVIKESEEGYTWVLRHLKALLNGDVQPNVVVTDFEKGLMNAIPIVFPNSSHLLCLWHIYAAVETRSLDITHDDVWAKYISSKLFGAVVEAGTRAEFDVAWEKLCKAWPAVGAYIGSTWIPHYEKWCKFKTNKLTHFGNTTTSSVESAHANLKKWLNSAKLVFDSIWSRFHSLMETQHVEIRHLLELSRSKQLQGNVRLFSRLTYKLSKKAIIALREEFERGAKMTEDRLAVDCGCVMKYTHGLLCACTLHRLLRAGSRVPLDVLHVFWRKLEYDGNEAMPCTDNDQLEKLFDEIRDCDPSMRMSMYDALYSQLHPDQEDVNEPAVIENPRGRPKKATRRDPSAVEHARRRNSKGKSASTVDPSSRATSSTPSTTTGTTPSVDAMSTSTGNFSTSFCAPLEVNYVIGDWRSFHMSVFLPPWFKEYLEAWFDPRGDGHCGYRVISHALRGDQNHFTMARLELLREMQSSATYRDVIYGRDKYDQEVARIRFLGQEPCGEPHWMDVLDLYGFATIYNWVICVVSSFLSQGVRHWGTSYTYMPLRAPPVERPAPYGVLWVLHTGNHYMRIRPRPLSPMPPIAPFWQHDGTVGGYREMYRHQFAMWSSFNPRR